MFYSLVINIITCFVSVIVVLFKFYIFIINLHREEFAL